MAVYEKLLVRNLSSSIYYTSQVSMLQLLRLMFYHTNILQFQFIVYKINISHVVSFTSFFENEMSSTILLFIPRGTKIIIFVYLFKNKQTNVKDQP